MGFFQSNKQVDVDQFYIVRVMTRTISIATTQTVNSSPYKMARQSFMFSSRFTVTKTFGKTLSEQGSFGIIIGFLIIPICIGLDVLILVFGLGFGSVLLAGIIIFFVFYVIYLLIKSLI